MMKRTVFGTGIDTDPLAMPAADQAARTRRMTGAAAVDSHAPDGHYARLVAAVIAPTSG